MLSILSAVLQDEDLSLTLSQLVERKRGISFGAGSKAYITAFNIVIIIIIIIVIIIITIITITITITIITLCLMLSFRMRTYL